MTLSITVPRVNNNDDEVRLVDVCVGVGQAVQKADVVARVETDKAVFDVTAPDGGYVLKIEGELDAVLPVGSVLMWLGATADEPIPVAAAKAAGAGATSRAPVAKAKALLAEYGIDAADVPASGERLSVRDVQSYVAARGLKPVTPSAAPAKEAADSGTPDVPGELRALTPEQRGMLATVMWHRDVAVAGYIELGYDPKPWAELAQTFRESNKLLLDPVLPLMAWKLVEIAKASPRVNATIVGKQRYEYSQVNLGFTVQSGDVLYLTVTRDAAALGMNRFVEAMIDIQRRAAAHKLQAHETRDATVSFSSMARWKVSRHVPVLPPNTALIVGHTVDHDGGGVLGASYDHRVLGGADVVAVLRELGKPTFSNK